jgi:deferrochelatase/peroxidase EfeB
MFSCCSTNNDLEAWHHRMAVFSNRSQRTDLWGFIDGIRNEQKAKEVDLAKIKSNDVVFTRKRSTKEKTKEQLVDA